ncbi:hypothetical protein CES87_21195 [Pseudomonas sp. ERMR1:02]|nr:hypothetical protein CES87_21195 [Pseudomonas sp. ERMR1:02]
MLNRNHIDWFKAVMANDVEMIKRLIKNGANVNEKGPNGLTALVHVLFGNLDGEPNFELALELFQAENLKINKSNAGQFFSTLLVLKQYQDRKNLLEQYKKIIGREPGLNKHIEKVNSELDVVSEFYTTKETEKWQAASGNVINQPQLTEIQKNWFYAIQNLDLHTISKLIQFPHNVNLADHLGRTALWFAAYRGDVALLEILLASDGLTINKETAGEFYIELSVLRDCLNSGNIEKEEIRKALKKLTTEPYPSVIGPFLTKVGGVSPSNTSMINRFAGAFIGAFCASSLGGAMRAFRS